MNTKILLVSLLVIILVIGIFSLFGQNSTSNIPNNSSNSTNQNLSYVPVTNPAQNNSSSSYPSQNNIQHEPGVPL